MKNKQMTRILSLLLSLVLCLQMLPVPALAAEAETAEPESSESAAPQDGDQTDVPDRSDTSDPADAPEQTDTSDLADAPEQTDASGQADVPEQTDEAPLEEEADQSPAVPDAEEQEPLEPEELAPQEPEDVQPDEPEGEAEPEEAVSEVPTEGPTEEPTQEPTLSEQELYEQQVMAELDAALYAILSDPRRANVGSYAAELAKFPASYQTALKALHTKHPNWVFVAVDTRLDWNKAVAAEWGNRSTMEYNFGPNSVASHLLLNNRDGFYSSSSYSGTRHYKPLDGRFVSASRAAVAYYMDPRNFLTENYIFQFESETFSNICQVAGVTAILRSGCNTKNGMANKTTYVTTGGKTAKLADLSSQFGDTYPKVIYNVGKLLNVSPYFIASKIVQETSADTTTRVLTGTQSGYVGYYNFFNIGAYATSDGTAWKNGLKYAKNHKWFNPIVAIKGGVEFLAEKYVSKGQNTAYYMRFNVSPETQYELYEHQYMSATAAAAGEGSSTFKGYQDAGAQNSAFLFYIPVYRNMPAKTSVVSLTPTTTGTVKARSVLYNAPSATGTKLATVSKGASLTVLGGSVTSTDKYENRLYYPYWYKVKVTVSGKSYTGYLHEQDVTVGQVYHLKPKATKSISGVTKITGGYSGPIYYETSDPSVATVSATTGLIRAVGSGTCTIYAISGGGSFDAVGVKVSSSGASSSDRETNGPAIGTPDNSTGGTTGGTSGGTNTGNTLQISSLRNGSGAVCVSWKAYKNADYYRVWRRIGTGKWVQLSDTFDTTYEDYDVTNGKQYGYLVRAMVNGTLSPYDTSAAKSITYLSTPVLFAADASADGVTVSWEVVPGAKGYYVLRKEEQGKLQRVGTVNSGKTTTWQDSSALTVGKEYTYTVQAVSGSVASGYDEFGLTVVILEEITALNKVQIKSVKNSFSGVGISWSASGGAQGYKIYRKKQGESQWKLLVTTKNTKTYYTDTKAVHNTRYSYTVRAYRGSKLSAYDTAGKSLLYIAAPKLVSASATAKGITVNWKAVKGVDGYRVYRKKAGESSWKKIATVRGDTSYIDNASLKKGTKYFYTVHAYIGSVCSAYDSTGKSAVAGSTTANTNNNNNANNNANAGQSKTYVTTGQLNYRTGAGSNNALGGTFAKGTKVEVIQGGDVTVNGTVWYKVKVNGKYYYASSKYLQAA